MIHLSPENLFTKSSRCTCKEENLISLEKSYLINPQTMWLAGVYDRQGKQCSLVHETGRILFVDESPMEIIDNTILRIGFDRKGAEKATRLLLGKSSMRPVVINPVFRMILFPTHSPKYENNIWFNLNHIRTAVSSKQKNKTEVSLSNGSSLTVPSRPSSFNTQTQSAVQLRTVTSEAWGIPNFTF